MLCFCACSRGHAEAEIVHVVSLVNLIATPSQYDGKWVAVQGFLDVREDEAVVFLTKHDWAYSNAANAVWLRKGGISDERWRSADGKWITVRGLFDEEEGFGSFTGTIVEVDRLEVPLPAEHDLGSQ